MGVFMKFLNRAYNIVGWLRQKRKDQIIAYCRNPEPTKEDWDSISDIMIQLKVNVLDAVTALVHDFDAQAGVPDGFTVARALKATLPPQRDTTVGGPHAL